MPAPRLGPDTITLLIPAETIDPRDNTTYYTYTVGETIKNCSLQSFLMTEKFQEEFTVEREATRTFYRVFAPWTAATEAVDDKYRIICEGTEYEVHALAGRWRDFRGHKHHIAFLAKRRRG